MQLCFRSTRKTPCRMNVSGWGVSRWGSTKSCFFILFILRVNISQVLQTPSLAHSQRECSEEACRPAASEAAGVCTVFLCTSVCTRSLQFLLAFCSWPNISCDGSLCQLVWIAYQLCSSGFLMFIKSGIWSGQSGCTHPDAFLVELSSTTRQDGTARRWRLCQEQCVGQSYVSQSYTIVIVVSTWIKRFITLQGTKPSKAGIFPEHQDPLCRFCSLDLPSYIHTDCVQNSTIVLDNKF